MFDKIYDVIVVGGGHAGSEAAAAAASQRQPVRRCSARRGVPVVRAREQPVRRVGQHAQAGDGALVRLEGGDRRVVARVSGLGRLVRSGVRV